MWKTSIHFAVIGVALTAAGCGMEHDYVLREPLKIEVRDTATDTNRPVMLPAGTVVHRTFYKDGMAFITITGMAHQRDLDKASVENGK